MFLNVLQAIATVLKTNLKVGLVAILISVFAYREFTADDRLNEAELNCEESRRSDRQELKDVRERLMDAYFGRHQIEKKAHENDSLIRQSAQDDINRVIP